MYEEEEMQKQRVNKHVKLADSIEKIEQLVNSLKELKERIGHVDPESLPEVLEAPEAVMATLVDTLNHGPQKLSNLYEEGSRQLDIISELLF